MTNRISAQKKSLETRKIQIEEKRNQLVKEIEDRQKESKSLKQKITELSIQIDQLKDKNKGDIIISEHAVLRYIERVLGIDISEIEKKIIDPSEQDFFKNIGNCTYTKEDFRIKIQNGVVVTVLEK